MSEFISLLISYLLMAFADSVDAMFGNKLGVDNIVVAGTMASLSLLTKSISRIGGYTYRCIRKDRCKCLKMSAIAGIIFGIVIFLTRSLIINFYDISEKQKIIFNSCLIQWSIYIPVYSFGNDLFEQIRLDGKLKLYRKCIIIFYAILISTDVIAFLLWHRLDLLYAMTTLTATICAIIMYKWSNIEYQKIDTEFLINVKKYAIPIAIERFLNGVNMMITAVVTSRLGENIFAIHSVMFGAMCTGESVTNSYQAALMIKLPLNKGYKKSKDSCLFWAKKMFFISFGLYVCYMVVSILVYKGNISIADITPWFLFYMCEFFGLYVYETSKTLCINQCIVKYMPLAVPIGAIFRYILIGMSFHINHPFVTLGLAVGVDFLARGITYIVLCKCNQKVSYCDKQNLKKGDSYERIYNQKT